MLLHVLGYDQRANRFRTIAVYERNGQAVSLVEGGRAGKLWTPDQIAYVWRGKIMPAGERANGQDGDAMKQRLLDIPEEADGILVYYSETVEPSPDMIPRHRAIEGRGMVRALAGVGRFTNWKKVNNDQKLATVTCPYRFVRDGQKGLYFPR
ncbi:MAG: hypothetical protein HYS53_03540 [Candidatus Aenigmarchaeota archaeon]|nr:hypothetical protein [Candidatus Aenigmarchaeota archaeon]